jgi:uncharacterized RDD family membrane protein YckC
MVLGIRRDLADDLERFLLWRGKDDPRLRQVPLVRRLWAGFIDFLIAFSLAILILTGFSGVGQTEAVFDPQGGLLIAALALLYRIPYEALTGQSIGKVMMGISVYGPAGGVPGWWRAAARNLLGVIPLLWPIDLVLVVRSAQRQRLGDLLSKTTVRRVAV